MHIVHLLSVSLVASSSYLLNAKIIDQKRGCPVRFVRRLLRYNSVNNDLRVTVKKMLNLCNKQVH